MNNTVITVEVTFSDYVDFRKTHSQVEYVKAIRRMRADANKQQERIVRKYKCVR